MTQPRTILVTSALPYANGAPHLGHVVEYVYTDLWVRYQRLRGRDCRYVCASDAHGTPTMLKARQEGIPPEDLISRYSAIQDLLDKGVISGRAAFEKAINKSRFEGYRDMV